MWCLPQGIHMFVGCRRKGKKGSLMERIFNSIHHRSYGLSCIEGVNQISLFSQGVYGSTRKVGGMVLGRLLQTSFIVVEQFFHSPIHSFLRVLRAWRRLVCGGLECGLHFQGYPHDLDTMIIVRAFVGGFQTTGACLGRRSRPKSDPAAALCQKWT